MIQFKYLEETYQYYKFTFVKILRKYVPYNFYIHFSLFDNTEIIKI